MNWATRQLAALAESSDTLIRARWPGRAVDTVARIADAIRDPKLVAPDDKKDLPIGFEIQRVVDLAGRFKGSNTFIEDTRRELPRFYKEVVQNVVNWVPRAPRYKEEATAEPGIQMLADKMPTAMGSQAASDSSGELATVLPDPDEVT